MDQKLKEDIILSSSLFKNVTRAELANFIKSMHISFKSYKKGEYITRKGDKVDKIGMLLKGSAFVVKETASGDRNLMAILKQGQLFGEVGAFSDNPIWPSTVIAEDTAEVIYINRSLFISGCVHDCSAHQKLIYNMLNVISNKALLLNKKIEYLTIKNVRSKISAFILEQYRKQKALIITLPMNRNDLAEFLNITRPSLSRELARMKEEHIIDYYKSTVKILDLSKLQEIEHKEN